PVVPGGLQLGEEPARAREVGDGHGRVDLHRCHLHQPSSPRHGHPPRRRVRSVSGSAGEGATHQDGGRRRRAPRGKWALVLAGAVVIAVGIGVGLPHLAKEGATVGTVLGLALLAGGLAVFVGGVVVLVRPRRWPGRLLIVVASVVLLALVTFVVGQA